MTIVNSIPCHYNVTLLGCRKEMVAKARFDFKEYVAKRRQAIDLRLSEYLSLQDPVTLWESIRYSVLAGGKRLRALLCLSAAEAISESAQELAMPCACAIELVHAMSLIHDDLPALDNDDLRRGQPTNHKVFGEAMALLAGDALLMLAVEVIIEKTPRIINKETLLSVVLNLAKASGAQGLVGGQVEDMRLTGAVNQAPKEVTQKIVEQMHKRKTGALLSFSVWSGACLAGCKDNKLSQLARFGEILGLAFQIADDLLDITGDKSTLGKTPGKDQALDKTTWVSVFGFDESQAKLKELEKEAGDLLRQTAISGEGYLALQSLLEYAIYRES